MQSEIKQNNNHTLLIIMKKEKQDDNIADGFSSDEEFRQQELLYGQTKHQYLEPTDKQQVKLKIPPPTQVKAKSYSLYPDLATGWAPKVELPTPIPLIFDNQSLDSFLKCMIKHNNEKVQVCYLGPRYENTYYSWYKKNFTFPYGHIKAPNQIKFTNRPFCGQNQTIVNSLIFDSFFEAGNLDCAIKVGQRQYQLFIRVDSNTRGHLQWYNFKIRNLKKLEKYKFHICNFQKHKSLYTRGMKPYVFSLRKYQKQQVQWHQAGQHIRYDKKPLKSCQAIQYQMNRLYKLSFDFYSEYDQDQVQIAYCVPYTYSQLSNFLQNLKQRYEKCGHVQMNKLCTSLGGLEVPLLIIHQKKTQLQKKQTDQTSTSNISQKCNPIAKKCIIISGRAHPGQSNGSYMMQGFIQFICGDSKIAQQLRKNIIFKIIPMLNPDGVAIGNYRTGLSGKDFNRQFRNPDKIIFPEVYSIKKLVAQNKQIFKEHLLMFLDFHGHSIKKNVFMYGPEFPIIQKYYYETRIFPKILGNHTNMFRYYSCIFKVSEFKETTARAVVLRKLGIPFTYTIQASNGSYYNHDTLKDIPFNSASWQQMGTSIGFAIHQYVGLIIKAEHARIQKQKQKQKLIKSKQTKNLIRRNVKNSKNSSKNKSQYNSLGETLLILPGIQDEQIKSIFQEIKQAQQHKSQQKISDDELSEGSSDQQAQQDDLSPNKINFLYQIIKNKKLKSFKEKLDDSFEASDHRSITNQDVQQKIDEKNDKNDDMQDKSMQVFDKKRQINRRSFLCKNKKNCIVTNEYRRQKFCAPRIINFSFGSSAPLRGVSEDRSPAINKANILQLCNTSKMLGESPKTPLGPSRVLDLSDSFRKTFALNSRDRLQHEKVDFKVETLYPGNLRTRRFQDFKTKKNTNKGLKNSYF